MSIMKTAANRFKGKSLRTSDIVKKWKIVQGDKVIVTTGPDKGKVGKVFKVLRKRNLVLVSGVNITKRHLRPGQPKEDENQQYWFAEAPVHYSNVAHVHPETGKRCKVGFAFLDGKKVRIVRGTDIVIPKPDVPDRDAKIARVGPKDTPQDEVLRKTFDLKTLNPLLFASHNHKTWELDEAEAILGEE
eukprot:TRINITY_DN5898_c0_g1_i1.p1 TRINITY_DN5898_c0_g1~~TRINITY_DN5898_c0_g1_i1.p1  ORF type:complete len:188 (-),score=39.72 TRINITY_DN5898_c0_g1_i1:158-721(-)